MTILRSLRRESRAIDTMALWGMDAPFGDPTHAGVPVSQESALRLSAVWRCIILRSSTVAGLPVEVCRYRDEDRVKVDPQPSWLYEPNPEANWFEFIERVVSCLDLDGNAFIYINGRNSQAYPMELWTLHPQEVAVVRKGTETLFEWRGGKKTFTRYSPSTQGGQVLHIKAFSNGGMRGLSPIEMNRQGIGLGLVAEKFGARFFGSGQQLSGVITLPPSPAAATESFLQIIKKNWTVNHGGSDRSHLPGVLAGGADWKPLSIAPEQAQFIETRKFQVSDIARMFGIPPHKIGDLERSTFSNIEHQAIEFVTDAVLPTVRRLEAAFNQLTPRGQYIRWNLNGLLRGDAQSRFAAYATAIQNGWMNRNEVRHLEDLNSEDGLDEFLRLGTLVSDAASNTDLYVPGQPNPIPTGNGAVGALAPVK